MGYPVYYDGEIEIVPPFDRGARCNRPRFCQRRPDGSHRADLRGHCGERRTRPAEFLRTLRSGEGPLRSHPGGGRKPAWAGDVAPAAGQALSGAVRLPDERGRDMDHRAVRRPRVHLHQGQRGRDRRGHHRPSWAPEPFIDRSSFETMWSLVESADNEGCSPELMVVLAAPIIALREALPKLEDFVSLNLP